MNQDSFADLRRAIRRRFGEKAEIDNIHVPTLGGSNRTIVFDVVEGNARRRMVSRQETYTSPNSPFLPPPIQFRIMKVVHDQGFPAPEPVFLYEPEDEMGNGFVTAFVEGETMPKKLIQGSEFAEVRKSLAAQLGELLAFLHSLDPAPAAFLESWPDSIDPIDAQRQRLDLYEEAHPALELGLRWLESHRPPARRRSIVHGDFRMGNFMVGPNGVTAILDWECCHLGNGIADFGWLCTRSWRFGREDRPVGGFGEREQLYAAYEAAGGGKVDDEEVRYWEIFGLLRWTVINLGQAHGHVFGGRRSVVFAAQGRNASHIEYDLLMTMLRHYR